MHAIEDFKDLFKPRGRQKPRVKIHNPLHFSWVKEPVGIVAKICLMSTIERLATPAQIGGMREFKDRGITKQHLYDEVVGLRLPYFPGYFVARTNGNVLTPHILYCRMQNFFHHYNARRRKGYARMASDEHPMNDDRLRPYIGKVEKVFRRNREFTIKDFVRIFK